jgi:UDP-glucose 4-epimerase
MVDLLLARGFEVRAVDNLVGGRLSNLNHHSSNPRLAVEEIDVCELPSDAAVFRDVDYVFHFAGIGDIVPSIERPKQYLKVNVQGTVAVMEAARNTGVKKAVYAASSSCYGLATELPTSECAPIRPQYPYALSKYLGECVALHWHQIYRLPVNSVRIFNAYGPRSRTTGAYGAVFGVFLAQKLKDKPFTVVGDGTQTRDFVYATDVASAFFAAAETDVSGEIFNLGAGAPQSVNRLVELLGGPVVYVPKRPGEPDCTWADTRKIRSTLNWSPRVPFEVGVATMVQQISAWADAPVWTSESIAVATQKWFEHLDR